MPIPRRCQRCAGQLYLDAQEEPPDVVCLACGWRQSVRGPLTPLPLVHLPHGRPQGTPSKRR